MTVSIFMVSSGLAWAETRTDSAELSGEPGTGMNWENGSIPVTVTVPDKHSMPLTFVAQIKGAFVRQDYSLILNGKQLILNQKGEFEFSWPITGPMSRGELLTVGPLGEIEHYPFRVTFANYQSAQKDWAAEPAPDPSPAAEAVHRELFPLFPALSFSYLNYSQTSLSQFTEDALTLKLTYQKTIHDSRWDWAVNTFFTVLPLSSNIPNTTARFFGLNARVGYPVTDPSSPWRLAFMGGAYYTTMLVTNSAFGYSNEFGPQFYVSLSRPVGGRNSLSAYLKFAPLLGASSFIALANNEFAQGLGFSHTLQSGRQWFAGFDHSQLNATDSLGNFVNSASYNFTLGFRW